jgi:hypothetical protein
MLRHAKSNTDMVLRAMGLSGSCLRVMFDGIAPVCILKNHADASDSSVMNAATRPSTVVVANCRHSCCCNVSEEHHDREDEALLSIPAPFSLVAVFGAFTSSDNPLLIVRLQND